jgi:hypothetical protein
MTRSREEDGIVKAVFDDRFDLELLAPSPSTSRTSLRSKT